MAAACGCHAFLCCRRHPVRLPEVLLPGLRGEFSPVAAVQGKGARPDEVFQKLTT